VVAGEAKTADPGAVRPVRKQRLRLWIRLLRARQVIEAELRKRLRDRFDMTMPQFDVMAALERNPEGMTMSSLSEALMVSNGNVTGIIDRLMDRKYVARETFASDRRRFIVRLTPAGLDRFRSVATLHEGWVDELMSAVEIDQAETAFGKLAARL
jgi:DNA-binding MarR family transcriptional regulator